MDPTIVLLMDSCPRGFHPINLRIKGQTFEDYIVSIEDSEGVLTKVSKETDITYLEMFLLKIMIEQSLKLIRDHQKKHGGYSAMGVMSCINSFNFLFPKNKNGHTSSCAI